jgi:SMI1 / KNR4 family (SUKH-1)
LRIKKIEVMKNYDEQIDRIRIKLSEAKKIDKDFKVFGASSHKYQINNPISMKEIANFEAENGINLPESYKYFLSKIGNGGIASGKSAAGPFYGIYALSTTIDYDIQYLGKSVKVNPNMTDEYWKSLTKKIEEDDTITEEEYENELGEIYSGILPIGDQGCAYSHCLVLNGEFKGRVINIDSERHKPVWAFENDFLDWYERWLDEIISGELLENSPSWFGYTKGGTIQNILKDFDNSTDSQYKKDCLIGVLKKKDLDIQTIRKIEDICMVTEESSPYKIVLVEILCKFQYDLAKPFLRKLIDTNLLFFLKLIRIYAKNHAKDWLTELKSLDLHTHNSETFYYYTCVIEETKTDYAGLLKPYFQHENENIRASIFSSLGRLDNKLDYLDWFIIGLKDNSNKVVLNTLQALEGVKDNNLRKYYKEIAVKYEHDQYIPSNLALRFKDLNRLSLDVNKQSKLNSTKKWYVIWKN